MDEYNNYQNGYNQNPPPPRRPKKRMNARWLWIIPVLILVAILAMDSFYTLKEDHHVRQADDRLGLGLTAEDPAHSKGA